MASIKKQKLICYTGGFAWALVMAVLGVRDLQSGGIELTPVLIAVLSVMFVLGALLFGWCMDRAFRALSARSEGR
jgi:uncharacterized protein YacL